LQQLCVCQQFVLDRWGERIKFRLEFSVEKYLPRHRDSMYLESYVVKYIMEGLGRLWQTALYTSTVERSGDKLFTKF